MRFKIPSFFILHSSLFICLLVGCASQSEDPATRGSYYFETIAPDPLVQSNAFIREAVTAAEVPRTEDFLAKAPRAVWEGHTDVERAFDYAWESVARKIRAPEPGTNFKRNFVYTPFGKSVFVWGSCFITMFGQYNSSAFPFIEQLDNFYAAQRADGFIPRQLGIFDGRTQFAPEDLSSVGGNIFAWAEFEWFAYSGDKSRLAKVYPVLLAYHNWMRKNRTWKDGTYFSSGWGCGMDNIPRVDTSKYSAEFHHGFISWVDVTMQQIFDAKCLLEMAEIIGVAPDAELQKEVEALTIFANKYMWVEADGLYHDLDRNGIIVPCKHIGGFWALLADVAPSKRRRRLIANLEDRGTFAAPCGTRSLAKSERGYDPDGGCYWRGGVWCITDWAIVSGLRFSGETAAAHRLAKRHVEAVAKVFADTGTIWDSYDPEKIAPGKLYGNPVRKDFVGFSGVTPIAMLIRDVFGMVFTPEKIVWTRRLKERHGIENLTLPDGNVISLIYDPKDGKPVLKSSKPIELDYREE